MDSDDFNEGASGHYSDADDDLHGDLQRAQEEVRRLSSVLRELWRLENDSEEHEQETVRCRTALHFATDKVKTLKSVIESLEPMQQPLAPALQQPPAAAQPLAPQLQKAQKIHIPSNLPKFVDGTTDVLTFLREIESRLNGYNTRKEDYPKALTASTSGSTLFWVDENIIIPGLSWEQAKQAFIKEFTTRSSRTQYRRDLTQLKQGDGSCATFFRKIEQLAPAANQNLNEGFFLMSILEDKLKPHIAEKVQEHLLDELDGLTYARLKETACSLDAISTRKLARKTRAADAKCGFKGCQSTVHKSQECPKRSKKCTGCGNHGHLLHECRKTAGGKNLPSAQEKTPRSKKDLSQVTCHKCQDKGHYANKCPGTVKQETSGNKTKIAAVRFREPASDDDDLPDVPPDPDEDDDPSDEEPPTEDDLEAALNSLRLRAMKTTTRGKQLESAPTEDILAPCLFNSTQAMMVVDSASHATVISPEFAEELQLAIKPLLQPLTAELADDNSTAPILGEVIVQDLQVGERRLRNVPIKVMKTSQSTTPARGLLGLDLFSRIGITVTGVPTTYPSSHSKNSDVEDRLLIDNPTTQGNRNKPLKAIQPSPDKNAAIPSTALRTRSAVVIPTPNVNEKEQPILHGTPVMVGNTTRSPPHDPPWFGPFRVLKQTREGTYILQDTDMSLYPRQLPRHQLKVINSNIEVPTEDIYTVEAILNHRGPEHKREFLIKWKGFPTESNTWEPESNLLTCQNLLQKYWTKRLPPSNAASTPPHSNAEPPVDDAIITAAPVDNADAPTEPARTRTGRATRLPARYED
jgi:hypothetical protein